MKTGLLNTLQTGNLGLQIFIVSGTAYCSDGPMILNTNKNAIFLLLNTKQNITYCVTIRRFRAFKEKKYYGNKQLITEAGKCLPLRVMKNAVFVKRNSATAGHQSKD
jgi:hypothetical protein